MRSANILLVVAIALSLHAPGTPAFSKAVYVDDDATGADNGTSWQDAYRYLQDALYAIDPDTEVRVAQGTYRPNETHTAGRNMSTFHVDNDTRLLGGYAGVGAPDPNERDVHAYETVLTGDLNGDDIEPADVRALLNAPTRSENSFMVVSMSDCWESALLDGFTITGAMGHGVRTGYSRCGISNCAFIHNASRFSGAAILNESSHAGPTIRRCTFIGNATAYRGGAIANTDCDSTIIECEFIANMADQGGALANSGRMAVLDCTFNGNTASQGGAIHHTGRASIELIRCAFVDNHARDETGAPDSNFRGGAMSVDASGRVTLRDCAFCNNSAYHGGALAGGGHPAIISGCRFTGNSATYGGAITSNGEEISNGLFAGNRAQKAGGAIYRSFGVPKLASCTFADNWAPQGRAVSLGTNFKLTSPGTPLATNCIFRDGGDEVAPRPAGYPDSWIRYSDIHGEWPGAGNLDADPCFAEPGRWVDPLSPGRDPDAANPDAVWVDGDYHLKSQGGRWHAATKSWVKDDATSPCIDAGAPNSPIGREPSANGGRINLGAYAGTAEASKSYFGGPPCEAAIVGDINGDCKVDSADLAVLSSHWLQTGALENLPPRLTITYPTDGAIIRISDCHAPISLQATATDADGDVMNVTFAIESRSLLSYHRLVSAEAAGDVWTARWTWQDKPGSDCLPDMSLAITVTATDDDDAATSVQITATADSPPFMPPPR